MRRLTIQVKKFERLTPKGKAQTTYSYIVSTAKQIKEAFANHDKNNIKKHYFTNLK